MAELLIRLKNNTHADPVKDRMCYKRGDVVVVKPDGHPWGRAEGLPAFAVIRTDKTVAVLERYIAVHETTQTETRTIPFAEWAKMKAQGDYGPFNAMLTEGPVKIQKNRPKRLNVSTVSLSGPVQGPHTRRKWGVVLDSLPVQKARDIKKTGRAIIPFSQLRIALKNKITGAQA